MEKIRSFIAIELSEEVKDEISRFQEGLKKADLPNVKWVDPAGIHLTLKFLGYTTADTIPAIITAIEEAAAGIPPFLLTVGGLGVFPGPGQTRVAWVGMAGDTDTLGRLKQRLDSGLAALGFTTEKRGFTPHLTLARVRELATAGERQKLAGLIASADFAASRPVRVDNIYLIRSLLTPKGAVYSRIGVVSLQGPK
ncbi:MAG: RNA 2',3'-cyclic phosphodiesterase [Dehalococcoidales bacterium]